MTAVSSPAVTRRHDLVLIFDVANGNPNGDPDAGNSPRVDPETGHGLVSDVCLKRKIRNYVTLAKSDLATGQPLPGYDIYVKERGILNLQHERAYEAQGLKSTDKAAKDDEVRDRARAWMCQTFFDIRMFGAVMTTDVNCGQVRGTVQVTFARSVDPIVSLEQAITRMAVTTEREAKAQEGGNRTMGRKELVPYGLYVGHGFISPHLAAQTGFSGEDLDVLRQALCGMFELDRSAARGVMTMRAIYAFEHESALGNAPAHRLFERVRITRRDASKPPRAFTDYDIAFDEAALPSGVRLLRWCE